MIAALSQRICFLSFSWRCYIPLVVSFLMSLFQHTLYFTPDRWVGVVGDLNSTLLKRGFVCLDAFSFN